MINANELRIGNWVMANGINETVKAIHDIYIQFKEDSMYVMYPIPLRTVEPIQLTPEILEKCGFERGDNLDRDGHYSYERDGIVITNNETSFEGGWGEEIYMKVDHLHQLQNLYFALTNQELNVQL